MDIEHQTIGNNGIIVKEKRDLVVGYQPKLNAEGAFGIVFVVTLQKIITCMIGIRDAASLDVGIRELEGWLKTIEPINNKDIANVEGSKINTSEMGATKTIHVDLDENDKIDGMEVLQLWIEKDFFFFNDNDYTFDGKHHIAKGIQLNSARMDDLPANVDLGKVSVSIKLFIDYIEEDEKLICPIGKIGEEAREFIGNEDLTGLTLIRLIQEHLISIVYSGLFTDKKEDNIVIVSIDPVIKNNIPEIDIFLKELITESLKYNGKEVEFELKIYEAPDFDIGMRN